MFRRKLTPGRRPAALIAAAAVAFAAVVVLPPQMAQAAHSKPGMAGMTNVAHQAAREWWVWAKTSSEVVHGAVDDIWLNYMNASGATPRVRVSLIDPDGAVAASATASGMGGSTSASASGKAGLWKVRFDTPQTSSSADGTYYFYQDAWVTDGSVDKTGRVFAHQIVGAQGSASATFNLWVVAEDGTMFKTTFTDYGGVNSAIGADGLGLYKADSCMPTGKSRTQGGLAASYPEPAYSLDAAAGKSDCGQAWFSLFADQPDPDLPAHATHAGETVMVAPQYSPPTRPDPDLRLAEGAPWQTPFIGAGGTLGIDGFRGQYQILIDANGDGDTADPADRVLTREKPVAAGDVTWTWDGKDGQGTAVANTATPKISVRLIKGDEYYQVLRDVEWLRGVQVQQIRGHEAAKAGGPVWVGVHWDDTDVASDPGANPGHVMASLLAPGNTLVSPPTGLTTSAGPTHGWADPTSGPGGHDSWGNNADIAFGVWSDLSADETLAAPWQQFFERQLAVTSKSGALSPASGPAGKETRAITYTVKIKNTSAAAAGGETDFTVERPAVVKDTLPAHVSNWTYLTTAYSGASAATASAATAATAAESAGVMTWTGPLKAGETATVTYRVTVTPGHSASRLNSARPADCAADFATPGGDIVDTRCDPAAQVSETLLPGLKIEKTVDSAGLHKKDNTAAYTVTITNIGRAAFTAADPAKLTDDLSAVLDDATLDAATLLPADAKWDPANEQITWSGPLAVGASRSVTYTVKYDPGIDAGGSDLLLENTASIRPVDMIDQTPGEKVSTSTPGSDLHASKRADKAVAKVGEVVTYTLVLDNARGQAAAPVNLTDDLTQVLDDAVWEAGPTASSNSVTVTRAGDRLSLGGSVGAGAKVTVTYQVRIKDAAGRGDGRLANWLVEPDDPPPGECVIGDPLCAETLVDDYKMVKSVDRATAKPGQVVTYTLTFTNLGAAPGTVALVDALQDVLDDAELIAGPVASADGLVVEFDADAARLAIGGVLPEGAGASATVTYGVKVKAFDGRGDHRLRNVVTADLVDPPAVPAAGCGPESTWCTQTLTDDYQIVKTADRQVAEPGQVVTYSLKLTNLGSAAASVDATDDLSGVLDDADMLAAPQTDSQDLDVIWDPEAAVIRLVGSIPPPGGSEVNVVYSVKVRSHQDRGDHLLSNVVVPAGQIPPAECAPEAANCTATPVRDLAVTKSVNVARLRAGQTAEFRVEFTNRGHGDAAVDHHDLLDWVLDDGDWAGGPTSDHSGVGAVWAPESGRIEFSGALAPGQSAVITYRFQVTKVGDMVFNNFVVEAGGYEPQAFQPGAVETPPVCDLAAGMVCTVTPIDPSGGDDQPPVLPFTGTHLDWIALLAVTALLAGAALLVVRRRVDPGDTPGCGCA